METSFQSDDSSPPDNSETLEKSQVSYNLDMTPFPHPLWCPWPLGSITQQLVNKVVVRRLTDAAATIDRPLQNDEINALAYHISHALRITSYGQPLGISAGLYRAWATRETFKFPFRKPKANFNPEFVGRGGRAWLSGIQARTFWHVARTSSYVLVGAIVIPSLVGGYAASVAAVGELRDPRLEELNQVRRTDRAAIINKAATARKAGRPNVDITGQGHVNASDLWKGHRKSIGADEVDDMSPRREPTVDEGAFQKESEEAERINRNENSDMTSEAKFSRPITDIKPASPRRWPSVASTSNSESSKQAGFFDSEDEASPTARSTKARGTNNATNSWAKVRQEAVSKSQVGEDPAPRSSSEEWRAATSPYSNEEVKKQSARDAAQKEFDRLLEKERNAGQESNGNPRW